MTKVTKISDGKFGARYEATLDSQDQKSTIEQHRAWKDFKKAVDDYFMKELVERADG